MLNMALETTDMCIYQHPEIGGHTAVYAIDGTMRIVEERAEALLNHTLIYFGSDIKTRRQSAKVLIHKSHHLPIIIEPTLEWMYYPVHKEKKFFQMYIHYKMIFHFEGNKEETTLYFINGTEITVAQNVSFIKKQHDKALYLADLQSKIIKRQLPHRNYRL
ncbi:competence protein ComK [Macrococcoides caseolyticum]|uniref:competence protein ComK n=1 Tax=Macrococcoides caseolyticum TaxID=69966 RepID=UPI001F31F229|nr:competence protein ComK [Macrococcus caseolyticus]MCE4955696.1 competence protein ComK [Macrococcus caseolyticus]